MASQTLVDKVQKLELDSVSTQKDVATMITWKKEVVDPHILTVTAMNNQIVGAKKLLIVVVALLGLLVGDHFATKFPKLFEFLGQTAVTLDNTVHAANK